MTVTMTMDNGCDSGSAYGYGWATLLALFLILIVHCVYTFFFASAYASASPSRRPVALPDVSSSASLQSRIIISEADLKFLIDNLDTNNQKWESVIHKTTPLLSYSAKCSKSIPKDGPTKYLSFTVFENCSPELLRDFYMDNDYRMQWDKTIVQHEQLQIDTANATEIGRTIKKFPLLTPREYVLAWRLWEGRDQTFYCFIKECEHPLAPRQRKYVRVGFFRSGWKISKVPGRNACEIKMVHQEDAGMNVEMAKLAFSKGIWSYVRKMDGALRKYSVMSRPQRSPPVTAVSLIHKIPTQFDTINAVVETPATATVASVHGSGSGENKEEKFPSRKVLTNGLILLGGVICVSRGHSSLGANLAIAYILTKLGKRANAPSRQRGESSGARPH